MPPALTVIAATHNGEPTLRRMLDSLLALEAPAGGWQLIFVDNASSNRTAAILGEYRAKLPLTVLAEPGRGKNRALYRALQEPLGELVVFTDDDNLADPRWLIELQDCAARHPEVELFGGTLVPSWEDGPIALTRIWGPNMMVRRRVFERGHRFNENVGPSASLCMMGSETEFNLRIVEAGSATWYCPTARVAHIIRARQLTREWIMKRAIRFGRAERFRALRSGGANARETSLFGLLNFPRWMPQDFLFRYLKGQLLRLAGSDHRWADILWEAHLRLG